MLGIELCFAELKDPVKDKLKRFGLFTQLGEEGFFPTLGAAVSAYLKTHSVDWKDWEDRTHLMKGIVGQKRHSRVTTCRSHALTCCAGGRRLKDADPLYSPARQSRTG